MTNDDEEERSDLIDVSHLSIDEVRKMPETALKKSLERLFEELDSDIEPVAGFQSGIR